MRSRCGGEEGLLLVGTEGDLKGDVAAGAGGLERPAPGPIRSFHEGIICQPGPESRGFQR